MTAPHASRFRSFAARARDHVLGYDNKIGVFAGIFYGSDGTRTRDLRRDRGEIDHWLDVGLPAAPTKTRLFIFQRYAQPDFDERDRLVAELLQPHLVARAEDAETALRVAAALGDIEEDAGDDAGNLVLCSRAGVIES